MPVPYQLDLRLRVVWLYLAHRHDFKTIASLLNISDRTVRRYIDLFVNTGEVEPRPHKNGPSKLLDTFEQVFLLQCILENPGIYLHEIKFKLYELFGVEVSASTICRTLHYMGCSRQKMHLVALQQSDVLRGKFMADISVYDPNMLVWLDESGFDKRNAVRKYGYSIRGIPLCDQRLLIRGTRYTAIPIVSLEGVHDVYLSEGTTNGDRFAHFVRNYLLPILLPFNGINPRSVCIMDNASIHHVEEVKDLIEAFGAKLIFLPPYSPDLNPVEGIFSQTKSIIKENYRLFEACIAVRPLLSMAFEMVSVNDCYGHIKCCGYI